MSISQRLFAAWYDILNTSVEGRLASYRDQTAGHTWGDVLEIGGGTGANLAFYPKDINLTVIEPNPHMAKRFRKRARKLGRDVTIVPDVGEELPFADNSFDSVVTTLVLCMVDDLQKVVAEARRVLRTGGTFLFYEHVVSHNNAMRWWQNRLNPVWKLLTTGCNLNRDITGTIREAGFSEVNVTEFELSVGLPITIPNIVGVAKV